MFHDTMIWISEVLFFLLNGEPLINTPWVFVWRGFWILVMVLPLWYAVNIRQTHRSMFAAMAMFFLGLVMAIGPNIVQLQMLSECETVEVAVSTDLVELHTVEMRQCRAKENFYGEFGEWRIVPQNG